MQILSYEYKNDSGSCLSQATSPTIQSNVKEQQTAREDIEHQSWDSSDGNTQIQRKQKPATNAKIVIPSHHGKIMISEGIEVPSQKMTRRSAQGNITSDSQRS